MRYLMTFSYDGSNFYGYQKQNNERTVQGEIEKVLTKINGNNKVLISASGRTDRGVHAINQKAHFDMEINDIDKLLNSLNKLLPSDIYIKKIEKVSDDFHARFNVLKKEYIYKINMGEYNPLMRNYIYQYNDKLDIQKMIEASKYFIGTHNFKSFTKCLKEYEENDYVRTIYDISFDLEDDILIIKFIGSGFMRYMVRNLVGTLIEVGQNKKTCEDIIKILSSMNRCEAGKTIEACGLYLNDVYY